MEWADVLVQLVSVGPSIDIKKYNTLHNPGMLLTVALKADRIK